MRIFGWVSQLFGKAIPQTWDSDMPAPKDLVGGKSYLLDPEDNRTLDQLREDYPLIEKPEE
jgi:hypothetical protein